LRRAGRDMRHTLWKPARTCRVAGAVDQRHAFPAFQAVEAMDAALI